MVGPGPELGGSALQAPFVPLRRAAHGGACKALYRCTGPGCRMAMHGQLGMGCQTLPTHNACACMHACMRAGCTS